MNEPKSPFDGKMIIVIVLTFGIWVGYQSYLKKKYPDAYKKENVQAVQGAEATKDDATKAADAQSATAAAAATNGTPAAPQETSVAEESLTIEDDYWKVTVSNRGMGVSEIELLNFTDRENKHIKFLPTSQSLNLETNLIGSARPLYFNIEKTADAQITGVATVGDMKVIKVLNFDSARYIIRTDIRIDNPSLSFSGITTKISDTVKKPASTSFFNPQQEHQEFYVSYDGTDDRSILDPETESQQTFHKVNIAALASQYFALAVVDKSKIIPDFQTKSAAGQALGVLSHSKLDGSNDFAVSLQTYAGPKSWDFLAGIDSNLTALVNFGFFQTLAKWIFKLLQAIHAAVGNWGIAIILLTVLVRMIVLPFNIMSYRSMKAMAKVQPQLKAIREKYKNDAQMANQEIMRVMKEAKANPIGGCLPMLLQIPVFFALYQVLGQSIELYKAPFGLWIYDLSLKDPYFVLPVLMGATMFVQQKITPTTMEPAQQKVLMFMPIFLTFLLASLPSGLTLYMFVSTLFGVLQQLYFMRDEKRRAVATA